MKKDCWDKADIICKAILSLLALVVSVVLTCYGISINQEINKEGHNYIVTSDKQSRDTKKRELKFQEQLSQQEKQHEELVLRQKYIEIAVNILNTEPKKGNDPLRDWAIDIFKKYPPIPLTPAAIKDLRTKRLTTTSTSVNITGAGATGGAATLPVQGTHVEENPKTNRKDSTVYIKGAESHGASSLP